MLEEERKYAVDARFGVPDLSACVPAGVVGIRQEVSRVGSPAGIPTELVELVTVYTRGRVLAPAAVLRTTRRVYELRDGDGKLLAELDDDSVAVLDGPRVRF